VAVTVETDVLVVGAGPCGITLANLLGAYGVRALLIDRDTTILDFPRAVGIDDESLRTYQTLGVADDIVRDMIQNTPIRYYTSWGRCFAHVKPSEKPFGWARRNLFLQPLFEAALRHAVTRFPNVDVRYGHELVSLHQDDDGVLADVRAVEGETVHVRARYVVGADGGRSTVRRLIGVELTGATAPVKWLVVDVKDDQLRAPFSAVYCDPVRPVLVVPLPYGHRRFEFKLLADEDEVAISALPRVLELIRPLYRATPLPTVLRARVYLHHSRVAAVFQKGRVFLAGDAAHLQPPFFGQGMNSGIRDATNLGWKLAAVATERAAPELLDTYDVERRGHAAQMVGFATRIGRMYSPRSRITERVRDLAFRGVFLVPGGKEYILQMKYKPMPRYTGGVTVGGRNAAKDSPVGRMFMQPVIQHSGGGHGRLDDAIGPWFAVIGIQLDPRDHLSPQLVAWWDALGARFVRVDDAVARPGGDSRPDDGLIRIEDVDGAFRDWLLSRPEAEVVVLRPDRYVAAVTDRAGLEQATATLRAMINAQAVPVPPG